MPPKSDCVIILLVDEDNRRLRTQGLAFLTEKEREELFRLLKKTRTRYRTVHTKDGDEIVLLKVSVSGVIPAIMKTLHQAGVDLIDWFQQ